MGRLLKALFGGNNSGGSSDESGEYHYVRIYRIPGRPTGRDEVVEIRIDKNNHLSRDDSGTLFVRKHITGPRTFGRTEAVIFYDAQRNMIGAEVDNGEMVDRDAYTAYLATLGGDSEAESS